MTRIVAANVVVYMGGKRWIADKYGISHAHPLAFEIPPSNYDTPETQMGYTATRVMFGGVDATVDADPGDEDDGEHKRRTAVWAYAMARPWAPRQVVRRPIKDRGRKR